MTVTACERSKACEHVNFRAERARRRFRRVGPPRRTSRARSSARSRSRGGARLVQGASRAFVLSYTQRAPSPRYSSACSACAGCAARDATGTATAAARQAEQVPPLMNRSGSKSRRCAFQKRRAVDGATIVGARAKSTCWWRRVRVKMRRSDKNARLHFFSSITQQCIAILRM